MTGASARRDDLARDLVEVGRQLWASGLIGGVAGNLSARLGGDRIVITPTGTHKGHLTTAEMIELPLDATPEQAARGSSEFPFHRESYVARAEVGGVVHTHAPALIAVGIRGIDILSRLPEVALAASAIVTLPLLESGSEALGGRVGGVVAGGAGVVLLGNHGAVTVGSDVREAANRMELAELAAYAVLLAEDGGGAVETERVTRLAERLAGP